MERELKIVIGIIMTFFIYGLTSLFNFGGFVTPYFITPFIVLIIAVGFYMIHLKKPRAFVLLIFSLGYLIYILTDSMSVAFMEQRFGIVFFSSPSTIFIASLIGDIVLFGSILISILIFLSESKNVPVSVLLGVILLSVIILLFSHFLYAQGILTIVFFLTYFVVCHRIKLNDNSISIIVSDVYFLIAILESFEFFI